MRIIAALFAAACILSSCSYFSPAPEPPKTDISFKKYQVIALDVADIDIVDEYAPPLQEPNVEHLVPVSPADALRIWVKERLRAVGQDRTMQVIIKDASIVATPLPKPPGVKGLMYNSARRYDAKLVVEMRIYGKGAMSEANVEITAEQSDSLSEKATVFERKAFFTALVQKLMEAANSELERQMFKFFNGHISYAQTP